MICLICLLGGLVNSVVAPFILRLLFILIVFGFGLLKLVVIDCRLCGTNAVYYVLLVIVFWRCGFLV